VSHNTLVTEVTENPFRERAGIFLSLLHPRRLWYLLLGEVGSFPGGKAVGTRSWTFISFRWKWRLSCHRGRMQPQKKILLLIYLYI